MLDFFKRKLTGGKKPKLKYGGELIHAARDEFGLIQVVETLDTRSLHFGSSVQQSQILLNAPFTLAFNYQQKLEEILNYYGYQNALKQLLMLGVGGGTLATKLFFSQPKLQQQLVDLRPAVIEIAQQYFQLPEDPRIRISCQDAQDFIQQNQQLFDAIVIDIYNEFGLPDFVTSEQFLNQVLAQQPGLVLINLWQSDPSSCLKIIEFFKHLPGELELHPIEPSKNLILQYTRPGWFR